MLIMLKDDTCDSKRKVKQHQKNVNDIENNTFQGKDNMKMALIKVKKSKSNSHKHEIDTCKIEGAQKRQLEKLTEIEE